MSLVLTQRLDGRKKKLKQIDRGDLESGVELPSAVGESAETASKSKSKRMRLLDHIKIA